MEILEIFPIVRDILFPLGMGIFAYVFWRRHHQNGRKGYGVVWHGGVIRDFLAGLLITFLGMLGIFLVELLLGQIRVTGTQFDIGAIAVAFGTFLGGALFEEIFFRAFLLSALVILCRGNKWLAILLSAAFFGLVHIGNPNATVVTAFGNALGGIIYGIGFLGARNIWFPLGLHISWNFSQALLGFPVSGQDFAHIVTIETVGSDALTGGAYGPEGGLIGMIFRFVIMAMVLYYLMRIAKGQGNPRTLTFDVEAAPILYWADDATTA